MVQLTNLWLGAQILCLIFLRSTVSFSTTIVSVDVQDQVVLDHSLRNDDEVTSASSISHISGWIL